MTLVFDDVPGVCGIRVCHTVMCHSVTLACDTHQCVVERLEYVTLVPDDVTSVGDISM